MVIETERLILRKWTQNDAESLFSYAKTQMWVRLPAGLLTRTLNQVGMLLTMFLTELNAMQFVKKIMALR